MNTTRRALLGATAAGMAILATGCQPGSTAGAGDAALGALLDRLALQILHDNPETATGLAVSEEKAGGRYKDRLTDLSKEGAHAQLRKAQQAVTDLQAISRDSLSARGKVSYDVVLTALQDSNAAAATASVAAIFIVKGIAATMGAEVDYRPGDPGTTAILMFPLPPVDAST